MLLLLLLSLSLLLLLRYLGQCGEAIAAKDEQKRFRLNGRNDQNLEVLNEFMRFFASSNKQSIVCRLEFFAEIARKKHPSKY